MKARRAEVEVSYTGIDITSSVRKDLLNFSYTDNASGESDSISITLKDDHKKWVGPWFPDKGDVLEAEIITKNWRRDNDTQSLPCGLFYIDQPEYSGPPDSLTINAVSSPLNGNFKNVQRSRTWKNISLRQIANDIAYRAKMGLQYIGKTNPTFKEKEQSETPDATFLAELCEEEGLGMKVTDDKIIIFDEEEFEKKPSVTTYHRTNNRVKDYRFQSSLENTGYDGCNVKYQDPKTGKMVEYLYMLSENTTVLSPALKKAKEEEERKRKEEERKSEERQRKRDEELRKKGKKVPERKAKKAQESKEEVPKIYQLNAKVTNQQEAMNLARKTLRRLNKNEVEGSLTVVGNVDLLGAVCIDVKGFGRFDGKYYIKRAVHTIGSDFTTKIEIRRIKEAK